MHPRPYLAPYLPALLELTLPGLDSNDVFKTTVTLQLYHLILCWVPVQGSPVRCGHLRSTQRLFLLHMHALYVLAKLGCFVVSMG